MFLASEGALEGPVAAFLGRLGGFLGPLGALLGRPESILGRLEAILSRLEAFLDPEAADGGPNQRFSTGLFTLLDPRKGSS